MRTPPPPRSPDPAIRSWRPTTLEVAGLACLVLVGYGAVLDAYFLADDFLLIHTVLDGQDGPDWSVAVRHLYSTQYVETFRPLVTFIHTLAYAAWGARPTGYHLLNLCLHLVNAMLFLALARRMRTPASRLLPFFAAAIFAIHPAHPEAVTYIGSLPVLGCATFYLLALLSMVHYGGVRRGRWLALGLTCFALALASKEEAVSLPLAVGLVAFAFPWRPTIRERLVASARASSPYLVLLVLYLAYRRLIFGHVAPSYYREVPGSPLEILRGAGTFVVRLLSPINLAYAGPWGWPVFAGLLAALVLALALFLYTERPPVAGLAFCAMAFLIALVPLNKILIFGAGPDLSNSRFLYFPSLAFAAGVALVVCGGTRGHRRRWPVLAAVAAYLAVSLAELVVNNMAWADAAALMRTMQQESRRLTGNMADVEVVNLPDTVHGVLFNRGGFRRALLRPFVPDNAVHRRERVVSIPGHGSGAVAVRTLFPDPEALNASIEGRPSDATPRLRAAFRPREAKAYRGAALITHPDCPDAAATISVRGRGSGVTPFTTSMSASLSSGEPLRQRVDTLTYMVAVTDVTDGVAAEEVGVRLLPGAPWRLRYFTVSAGGTRESPDMPVRIPDGGSTTFLLELTPIEPPRDRLVVLRISGLNAPIIGAMPGRTVIELPDVTGLPRAAPVTDDVVQSAPPRGDARHLQTCPALQGIPTELDFGIVPILPQPLRQDRNFAYYGQAPGLLFWDDLRRRLIPMDEVASATVLLRASGRDLSRWPRTPALSYLELSPSLAALHASAPGQFIATGEVDISTAEAAFFLLHMRVVGATSPFAVLSWKGAIDEPDSRARAAPLVTAPDGYWHTYAIPLHSLPGWRSTPRVRYLRLHPVLSDGSVEIDSLGIIGPVGRR